MNYHSVSLRIIVSGGILLLLFASGSAQFVETGQAPGFFLKWGQSGSGDGQFSGIWGIAVDVAGCVYVAGVGDDRIQKFDQNGTFLLSWGSTGAGAGQFDQPSGITVSPSGMVYIADTLNGRIQKFDSEGTYISEWGGFGTGYGTITPFGVVADAYGNIFVVDTANHRILKFDSTGSFVTGWGSSGAAEGEFSYPSGAAVDAFGNVYVVDTENNRIQKFDSMGVFLTGWGSSGTGDGQFDSPRGVAVDGLGYVYVIDSLNHRVQKFNSSGDFLAKWGSSGTGDGQLSNPADVAVDAFGNVYVSDDANFRIQKFAPVREFRVQGEDARLNVSRVSLDPANRITVELKNNGSSFFRFKNTFNGQQWTLNPLGNSFTFDNLNFPGQEFRLYNTGRVVITPSSLGTPSFDLLTNGGLTISGNMVATDYLYTSDRNRKTDFRPVDVDQILAKVSDLSVKTWRFRGDSSYHIGPVGQDFYALFGLGRDEKHLSPMDTAGVALAAIQGLLQQLEEKETELLAARTRNIRQQEEIDALKAGLAGIERKLKSQSVGKE